MPMHPPTPPSAHESPPCWLMETDPHGIIRFVSPDLLPLPGPDAVVGNHFRGILQHAPSDARLLDTFTALSDESHRIDCHAAWNAHPLSVTLIRRSQPDGILFQFHSVFPTRHNALSQAIGLTSEQLIRARAVDDTLIRTSLQNLALAGRFQHAGIFELRKKKGEGHEVLSRHVWTAPDSLPLHPDAPLLHFPFPADLIRRLSGDHVISGKPADVSPNMALALTDHTLSRFFLIPLFLDNRLWGLLAFGDPEDRNRSDEEMRLFRSAARLIENVLGRKQTTEILSKDHCHDGLSEHAYAIIATVGLDGIISYVSPSWETRMGFPTDNLVGSPAINFIHPDDRNLCQDCARTLARNGRPAHVPAFRLLEENGTWRWLAADLSLLRDASGKPESCLWVAVDISKEKALESEVFESRENYRNLYHLLRMIADNAPDLIWAKDLEDRYLFANKALCDKLLRCHHPDATLGQTDLHFAQTEQKKGHHHTFGQICVDSDHQVRASGRPGRFEEDGLVRGQYLCLDVHKAPLRDADGHLMGTVGCGRDITDERRIERDLEEIQTRFFHFFNRFPGCAFVKDDRGRYLFTNRYMQDLFGLTDWKDRSADQLFPQKQAIRYVMEDLKALKAGGIESLETVDGKDGKSERIFRKFKFPLIREDRPTLIGGFSIDITREMETERELEDVREELARSLRSHGR